MPGRRLLDESELQGGPYDHPTLAWRRGILRETLQKFETAQPPTAFRDLAQENVQRWQLEAKPTELEFDLRVVPGDWGEVAYSVTKEFGEIFAVLNMANAYCPGGAYVEGTAAQEENMFRRTNCHFSVSEADLDPATGYYKEPVTALLNGENGRVYLDTSSPRVCIRGSEKVGGELAGYDWLPDAEVFPFYELRAAARDYRRGDPFDESDARRRICAQLDTLVEGGVRYAVLGASGCGAFCNPSETIAELYRDEIERRRRSFHCIVFAIYHAGYGPGNFEPFSKVMGKRG